MSFRVSSFYALSAILDHATRLKPLAYLYEKSVRLVVWSSAPFSNSFSIRLGHGVAIWFVTLSVCSGINGVWALLNDRFFVSSDPQVHNFLNDFVNIVNYILVCPGYVTFGIIFLLFLGQINKDKNKLFHFRNGPPQEHSLGRWIAMISIVFVAVLLTISNYADEFMEYKKLYWCQVETESGTKVLNEHGYFYLLLNASLLAVVVLTGLSALRLWGFLLSVEKTVKRWLKQNYIPPNLDEDTIKSDFSLFNKSYVHFKVFLGFLYLNLWTWSLNEPSGTEMLSVAASFLSLGILLFASVPKYHIQYWIHQAFLHFGEDKYVELETVRQRHLCTLIDGLVVSLSLLSIITRFMPTIRPF